MPDDLHDGLHARRALDGDVAAHQFLALAGDAGPELVMFNGGERLLSNLETRQFLSMPDGAGGSGGALVLASPRADRWRPTFTLTCTWTERRSSRRSRRRLPSATSGTVTASQAAWPRVPRGLTAGQRSEIPPSGMLVCGRRDTGTP